MSLGLGSLLLSGFGMYEKERGASVSFGSLIVGAGLMYVYLRRKGLEPPARVLEFERKLIAAFKLPPAQASGTTESLLLPAAQELEEEIVSEI